MSLEKTISQSLIYVQKQSHHTLFEVSRTYLFEYGKLEGRFIHEQLKKGETKNLIVIPNDFKDKLRVDTLLIIGRYVRLNNYKNYSQGHRLIK